MKPQWADRPTSEFLKIAAIIYVDPEYGQPWQDQFVARCRVTKRTFDRWVAGAQLPGPVKAMIIAHEKCNHYGLSYD